MIMATKQSKVLIPLQLILIVIALYGVRQRQHCKPITDIDIADTTMSWLSVLAITHSDQINPSTGVL